MEAPLVEEEFPHPAALCVSYSLQNQLFRGLRTARESEMLCLWTTLYLYFESNSV